MIAKLVLSERETRGKPTRDAGASDEWNQVPSPLLGIVHALTLEGRCVHGPLPIGISTEGRGLTRHSGQRGGAALARHEHGKQTMLRVPSRTIRRHSRNMRHFDAPFWRPARELVGIHQARRHELGERAVVTDPEGFHEHAARVRLDGCDVAGPPVHQVAEHDREGVVVDELHLVGALQHLSGR